MTHLVKDMLVHVKVLDLDQDGRQKLQAVGVTPDGKPIYEPLTKGVLLKRGQALPDNLAEGQLHRLIMNDAVGSQEDVDNAEQQAGEPFEDKRASAPKTDIKLKEKHPFDLSKLAEMSDAELAEGLEHSGSGAAKIVAAVGADVELAKRVLAAEKVAAKGDGRKTLVGPLEKLIEGSGA